MGPDVFPHLAERAAAPAEDPVGDILGDDYLWGKPSTTFLSRASSPADMCVRVARHLARGRALSSGS